MFPDIGSCLWLTPGLPSTACVTMKKTHRLQRTNVQRRARFGERKGEAGSRGPDIHRVEKLMQMSQEELQQQHQSIFPHRRCAAFFAW